MQSAQVLAESEAGVCLSDVTMLLAVELSEDVGVRALVMRCELTSLTGMLDTPISTAMNQQALGKIR